jgi:hypothetical protein
MTGSRDCFVAGSLASESAFAVAFLHLPQILSLRLRRRRFSSKHKKGRDAMGHPGLVPAVQGSGESGEIVGAAGVVVVCGGVVAGCVGLSVGLSVGLGVVLGVFPGVGVGLSEPFT